MNKTVRNTLIQLSFVEKKLQVHTRPHSTHTLCTHVILSVLFHRFSSLV